MKKVRVERSGLSRRVLLWGIAFQAAAFICRAQGGEDREEIRRCATMEAYHFGLQYHKPAKDPLAAFNEKINSFIAAKKLLRTGEVEIVRIPVVVHVVHNQPLGFTGGRGNPNISDEQVQSQIRILNEDYRRMTGTPGYNENPVGVDARIEFFLAENDPDGSLTTGITRTYYADKERFNPYSDAQTLADIISWPTDEYLNIWVCTLTGNYLGVAQFPSLTGIPGLDNADADKAVTDGVIIDYRSFGDVGAIENANYNQGRTTTHEVGHWLGLLHIWGDARCGDDYCEDTPRAETSNTTSCNDLYSNCTAAATRNMIENYMDYSPDRCMNIFTFNQMERMHAVLELSPRRARLVENSRKLRLEESDGLMVTIYPNPVVDKTLQVEVRHKGYQDVELAIADMQGHIMSISSYRQVWSRVFKEPVAGLTPGMYLLIVTNGNKEQKVSRFIVY